MWLTCHLVAVRLHRRDSQPALLETLLAMSLSITTPPLPLSPSQVLGWSLIT